MDIKKEVNKKTNNLYSDRIDTFLKKIKKDLIKDGTEIVSITKGVNNEIHKR